MGGHALDAVGDLEDRVVALDGHVLDLGQGQVPAVGVVDGAHALGRAGLAVDDQGLLVGAEVVVPHVEALALVLDEGALHQLHVPEGLPGLGVLVLADLEVVDVDVVLVLVGERGPLLVWLPALLILPLPLLLVLLPFGCRGLLSVCHVGPFR